MAVLTNSELAAMRKRFVRRWGNGEIDFDKTIVNAAFQAVEDWYQTNKAAVSTDIDTVTSPYVFTNEEKKWLGAMYFNFRFEQDEV